MLGEFEFHAKLQLHGYFDGFCLLASQKILAVRMHVMQISIWRVGQLGWILWHGNRGKITSVGGARSIIIIVILQVEMERGRYLYDVH